SSTKPGRMWAAEPADVWTFNVCPSDRRRGAPAPAACTGRPQRPNRPRISLSIIPIRKNSVEKAAAAGRECSRRVELCMKFAAYVGWKATIPTTRRKTENQGGSFVVEGCRDRKSVG